MKTFRMIALLSLLLCLITAASLAEENAMRLPAGLKTIEEEAFYNDPSITDVILPDGVESIQSRAFAGSSLEFIKLPASLTYIAPGAFRGQENLIAGAVEGSYAWQFCEEWGIPCGPYDCIRENDTYKYALGGGEAYILEYKGSDAYVTVPDKIDGCPVVSVAFMPEPVSDANARQYNTTLKGVTLPKTVRAFGDWAFNYCSALEDFTVPGHVETIGRWAFFQATIPNLTISKGVKTIESQAFQGAYGFASLDLPASVETIGSQAFAYCEDLVSVTIPEGVKTIRNGAFLGCSALKEITVPQSVTTLEGFAFESCDALEKAVILADITVLEEYLFWQCSNLKEVVLPEGLERMRQWAFSACSALETITLPEGLTSIGTEVFYYCKALRTLNIPKSVSSIAADAFYSCDYRLRLQVVEGSYAHDWCIEQSMRFDLV